MIKLRKWVRWATGTHIGSWWKRWKEKGKRPLERQRRRWVDNIKMDLGEM
jgi:hypothetical protein